jgi:hypothetical protein
VTSTSTLAASQPQQPDSTAVSLAIQIVIVDFALILACSLQNKGCDDLS